MKKFTLGLLLFSAYPFTSLVLAQETLAGISEAQTAREEGLPQIAVQKLRHLLQGNPSPALQQNAGLELVRAYLAMGDAKSAQKILSSLEDNEEKAFLTLQSHLAAGEWNKVLLASTELPVEGSPARSQWLFARAEAQKALGKNALAAADYLALESDPVVGETARWRRMDLDLSGHGGSVLPRESGAGDSYLPTLFLAEASLAKKDYVAAERAFRRLALAGNRLDSRAYASLQLGLARCLVAREQLDEAETLLEKLIEEHPAHEQLGNFFGALNEVYALEKNASSTELRRWSRDASQTQRQALAIYYQSQLDLREKGSGAALETLTGWLEKFPSHPLRAEVLLRYGQQLVSEEKWPEAIRHFRSGLAVADSPVLTLEIRNALASAFFSAGRFAQSADAFTLAAQSPGEAGQALLYNAALAFLRAADFPKFVSAYQDFSRLYPESPLRRDLLLEQAFLQARSGALQDAIATLQRFARDFPEHKRVPDAHLVLAELALESTPKNLSEASQQIALATQAVPGAETAERLDYLKVFQTTDTGAGAKEIVSRAEKFLLDHPSSTLEAEIRFKMGEAYFAARDFASAGTQFEIVINRFPQSPLLEAARFLAAQSSIRTMNPNAVDEAISLLEQVARMKGPLQNYARFEQATVKKDSGSLEEALVLYLALIEDKPPVDLLLAAVAARADTLYLLGGKNPARLQDAVQAYDELLEQPGLTREWKNLALYKKGKALELQGRKEEMLAAFYDVLTPPKDEKELPETLWFYRAGFEAAQALESAKDWRGAIAIYQKLANVEGPRTKEAVDRIDRLRLEYFIPEGS